MSVTLETIELAPAELQACHEAVEKLAYFRWLDAGSPEGGQLDFWLEAEQEWIRHCYVPHREQDGVRPQEERPEPELAAPSTEPPHAAAEQPTDRSSEPTGTGRTDEADVAAVGG